MAGQSENFLTDDRINNIERSFSLERLSPYLKAAAGNHPLALRLHAWNTSLSEALYGLLQGFEITLRNTFHEILTDARARATWYDAITLSPIDAKTVQKAQARLAADGKAITPGSVVATLTLGFWVSLTGAYYAPTLWNRHLYRAFSVKRKRADIYHRLDRIRKLRNRVAHHDILIGRDLMLDYMHVIETTTWICLDTAGWIKANSDFVDRYKRRPELLIPGR
jgi:hypothetical protein